MKFFFSISFFISTSVSAATVTCKSKDFEFIVESVKSEVRITHQSETVLGDGILNSEEVDLIASFPRFGEMTLFAKIGKSLPESYLYFQGQRNPVICR